MPCFRRIFCGVKSCASLAPAYGIHAVGRNSEIAHVIRHGLAAFIREQQIVFFSAPPVCVPDKNQLHIGVFVAKTCRALYFSAFCGSDSVLVKSEIHGAYDIFGIYISAPLEASSGRLSGLSVPDAFVARVSSGDGLSIESQAARKKSDKVAIARVNNFFIVLTILKINCLTLYIIVFFCKFFLNISSYKIRSYQNTEGILGDMILLARGRVTLPPLDSISSSVRFWASTASMRIFSSMA